MALREEHTNPTSQQRTRIAQERVRRPNMSDFAEAYIQIRAHENNPDKSGMPPSFYDHVHDRVYIQLLKEDGTPSGNYRAEDAIDPDPLNRQYRTVED